MKKYLLLLSLIITVFLLPVKAYAAGTCNSGSGNYSTATDGNCSFAGTLNGANGVLTVAAGTQLTVAPGQTIGASSIVIQSGGALILPANGSGSVKPGTFPWLLDNDGDGYPSQVLPDKVQTSAPDAKHYKKDSAHWTSTATPDCYDSNAQAHPGQVTFQTADRGDTSWDYDCSGDVTYQLETCTCQTCTHGCPAAPNCTYPTTKT